MRVAKIAKLPAIIRQEIEDRLAANGFGGYVELEADLHRRGWIIGKSSLHRWGMKLKKIQQAADREAIKSRAQARATGAIL